MEREKIEKLRKLEAKWRKEGDESRGVGRRIHHQFADELAQLLSELDAPAAHPAPEESKP